MASGVKSRDKGYKRLVARAMTLGQDVMVSVGIHEKDASKPYPGGKATLLDVAIWNEFGTDRIPSRSFIRGYVDEKEKVLREGMKRLAAAVLAGKYTREQAFELFGQRVVGGMQERISQGIPPPNAPSTVAKKGSSKPLIDTGQLRSSITYTVRIT